MIHTIVARRRKRLRTRQEIQSVDGVVLPRTCTYFLSDDLSLKPYLAWSSLSFVFLFAYLILNKQLLFLAEPERIKQAIDIEFVSSTDFKNKNDILPATEPKPTLAKKISPTKENIPDVTPSPSKQIDTPDVTLSPTKQINTPQNKPEHQDFAYTINTPQSKPEHREFAYTINTPQSQPQHHQFAYTINTQQSVPVETLTSLTKIPARPKSNLNQIAPKPTLSDSPPMQLEEVAPFAMTEIMDNEGDNSIELWQNGGRSSQGYGARSSLTDYLKDLHKKLKHTWTPPPGPAHHIKVLFRLSSTGSVVSLKLMSSSGDTIADNSALEAIKKASPFGKLPKDYSHPYLDLAYTFNYSADELNEVPSPPTE